MECHLGNRVSGKHVGLLIQLMSHIAKKSQQIFLLRFSTDTFTSLPNTDQTELATNTAAIIFRDHDRCRTWAFTCTVASIG